MTHEAASALTAVRVIDADGHYLEPPQGLADYITPRYRDWAPHVVRRSDGTDWWEGRGWWDDNPTGGYRRASGIVGLAGIGRWRDQNHTAYESTGLNYLDANHAAHDATARLSVMTDEGIDAAVLYPSQSLVWVRDRDYAEALLRALNDWLGDWIGADRSRLYGVVHLGVVRDVSWACEEVRRCVDRYGFKAVCIRNTHASEDARWWDTEFDPLWATCQDLDIAVGIHPVAGDTSYGASRYFGMAGRTPIQLFLRTPFANPVDMMNVIGGLIGGGVLERFPRLRVAILESGGGWLVSFLERLDSRFEHVGNALPTKLSLTPSDYFRRQCWISFDPEEAALTLTAKWLGADRIIWGSDFPHPDAFFPGVLKMLEDNLTELPQHDRDRILRANAAELYGLR